LNNPGSPAAQFRLVADNARVIHSHPGAFPGGFDKEREPQEWIQRLGAGCKFLEGCGGQACIPPDALGHGFVQSHGVRQYA